MASAQTIKERLILTDSKDSLLLKGYASFDKNGDYCFTIYKDELYYWITNTDTFGGYNFIGGASGPGGGVSYPSTFSQPENTPYIYKNYHGKQIYGPIVGKLEDYTTSETYNHIALLASLKDSVYYYIDGRLISSNRKDPGKVYDLHQEWVAFNSKGNAIYSVKDKKWYYIYANNRVVDSSKFEYLKLAINNNEDYIFAEGRKPEQPVKNYEYMFFIHTTDTILDTVRTVWYAHLKDNGAYYFSGSDKALSYIAINDHMYKDIDSIENIALIDKNTYLFSFTEAGKRKINANGKSFEYDFEHIFLPTLDTIGNFACYGLKDYYLYKFINGKRGENPISKYNVRPKPLYISPTGVSLHYFKTDDSIYIYRDEKLILPPISVNSNFGMQFQEDFTFLRSNYEVPKNINSLMYLEYNNAGYMIFNGELSKPMSPFLFKDEDETNEIGSIITGDMNDKGFFIIQKIGDRKYLININNSVYQELSGIDNLNDQDCFFDGKSLIFYGTKGLSFYQFTLNI